jgi:hypothetical protein
MPGFMTSFRMLSSLSTVLSSKAHVALIVHSHDAEQWHA